MAEGEEVVVPVKTDTKQAEDDLKGLGDAADKSADKAESAFARLNKRVQEGSEGAVDSVKEVAGGVLGLATALAGAGVAALTFSAQIQGKAQKSLAALTKEGDKATFAFQALISESGAASAIFNALTLQLQDLNAWIIENNVAIQEGLLQGVSALGEEMVALTPYVEAAAATLTAMVGGLDMLIDTVVLAGTGLAALTTKAAELTTRGFAMAVRGGKAFLDTLASLADALGDEASAKGLRKLSADLQDFAVGADAAADTIAQKTDLLLKDVDDQIVQLTISAGKWEDRIGNIGATVGSIWSKIGSDIKKGADEASKGVTDQTRRLSRGRPGAQLWLAQQEAILELERQILAATRAQDAPLQRQLETQKAIAEAELARLQERSASTNRREKELIDARAELATQQALYDLELARAEIARQDTSSALTTQSLHLQLELLGEQDEKRKLVLARQVAELEANAALAASEGTINDQLTARIAIKQAELDQREGERALAEEAKKRADELTALAEEAAEKRKEQQEKELELIKKQADQIGALGDAYADAFSVGTGPAAQSLAILTGEISKATAAYNALRDAGIGSTAALQGAATGAAGALGGVFATMIQDTRKAAGVQAAFAAAQAILFGAQGNIPAAIAAGASAVKFGIVAGTAEQSAPSTGTASAGTGTTSTGFGGGLDLEQAQRQNATLIAEALGSRQQGGVVINLNLQNATLLEDSVVTGKRLTDTVLSGLEQRGVTLAR